MKNSIEELASTVFCSTSRDEYGDNYQDHLLEQYKLFVEMTDRISERRATANSFFLSVITLLVSVMGLVFGFGTQVGPSISRWITLVSIVGVILCYSWYKILESYRQLNNGKFKVIHAIEKKLPLALFHGEWKALGEGKAPHLYQPLTHVEEWVPRVFAVLFVLILVFINFIR